MRPLPEPSLSSALALVGVPAWKLDLSESTLSSEGVVLGAWLALLILDEFNWKLLEARETCSNRSASLIALVRLAGPETIYS